MGNWRKIFERKEAFEDSIEYFEWLALAHTEHNQSTVMAYSSENWCFYGTWEWLRLKILGT